MYRIAICDDDKGFAEELHHYIKEFCCKHGIEALLKAYTDSDELMDVIDNKNFYDLYILDVRMPAYSGMELLEVFQKRAVTTDVILLTAYMDYAVDACRYQHVFRYIPKSLYKQRLEQALKDFFIKMEQAQGHRPYVIHNHRISVKFYQEDIVYIYKNRKYAVFVKKNGEEERERATLASVYEKLNSPDMIMLDRCYIVNLLHISKIQSTEVILGTGISLHTSKGNIQKAKEAFCSYWGELI
ncbi:MAG: response regulator transcription factor [Lachnospiraceae bacterium]|nr:response regulator transcription factor [Lachnospiraceae bacterium]